MESTTRTSWAYLFALSLQCGCGDSSPAESSSDNGDASGSAGGTSDTTPTDTESSEFCAPPASVFHAHFAVGTDYPMNDDQSQSRPAGRYAGECTIEGVVRNELPEVGAWELEIALIDCTDEAGLPTAEPFGAVLVTDVIEGLPRLTNGVRVAVDYTIEIFAPYVYQSWYSLRDADTGKLLVAAFSEKGPRVGPGLSGAEKSFDWLLPFRAELGGYACPPDPAGCGDPTTPRQRFLEVCRDTKCWDVVGTSAAQLDDYLLHLGFAGDPDVCDSYTYDNPIEGILAAL